MKLGITHNLSSSFIYECQIRVIDSEGYGGRNIIRIYERDKNGEPVYTENEEDMHENKVEQIPEIIIDGTPQDTNYTSYADYSMRKVLDWERELIKKITVLITEYRKKYDTAKKAFTLKEGDKEITV